MRLIDHAPKLSDFASEAALSLSMAPPELSSKHLYDERGSQLFDAITRVEEYYLSRVERQIFERHQRPLAEAVGPGARVVEFGSGMGGKTQRLLAGLDSPEQVVLIDISKEALMLGAQGIEAAMPQLSVTAICADYGQEIEIPPFEGRSVVFFPGSTLGNFSRAQAVAFLGRQAHLVGAGGGLILGVDLVKAPKTLIAAYDDSAGVTADFNLNLLWRLRAAGGQVEPAHFEHQALWVPGPSRVEMHLVAKQRTQISVLETSLTLEAGQSVFTESCHKYTPESIGEILREAGWQMVELFSDPDERFAVVWATA